MVAKASARPAQQAIRRTREARQRGASGSEGGRVRPEAGEGLHLGCRRKGRTRSARGRDRAQEPDATARHRAIEHGRRTASPAQVARPDPQPVALEGHLDRPVDVGSQGALGDGLEARDRRRRRVPVRVVASGRDDRDSRPDGLEERCRRRRPRPVVRDLEQVDHREAAGEELGIDLLLHVAGQQEALAADLAEQDDRDVVDRRAAVRGTRRDPTRIGPQDPQPHGIDAEAVAGRERIPRRPVREGLRPGRVAGTGPEHARLVHPSDSVPLEEEGEPRDVVLVGMAQDHGVDSPVPRRQSPVEGDQQSPGIWPTVHQEPAPEAALDEDRVTLADVEHHDPRQPIRPVDGDEGEAADHRGQGHRAGAAGHGAGRTRRTGHGGAPPTAPDRCPQSPIRELRGHDGRPAMGPDQERRGGHGGHPVPRRAELDARERDVGAQPHRLDDRAVQRPCG